MIDIIIINIEIINAQKYLSLAYTNNKSIKNKLDQDNIFLTLGFRFSLYAFIKESFNDFSDFL